MNNRTPRRRRRLGSFDRLEPRRLLTAVIGSDPKIIALTPPLMSGNWEVRFPGDRLDAEASARQYLATISDQIGIRADTGDLMLVETKHGLASTHTRFQQSFAGIPVHGATVTVNQGPDGSIQNFYSTTFAALSLPATARGGIGFDQADAIAQQAAGVEIEYLPSVGALVWLPFSEGPARLAWRIEVHAYRPVGDFLTLIDAQTGQLYSQENRTSFDTGSGMVYHPNPYQTLGSDSGLTDNDDATSAALTDQRVSVTLQGLDSGTGLLSGEYVNLASLNSTSLPDVDANELSRVYNYTRDDDRFEQVTIYHSIDSIQRYFHTLGFDDANPVPNGIRDFPTLANAHWDTEDQSFYSTGDDAVHFGDGGVDDGEDADIVAHEYGHAVQYDQNASWGSGGQTRAMGEGFGDYLAASFYEQIGNAAYQASDAACVGEWDATSYDGGTPPCLRRVDGNKHYPEDIVGQEHADGEIWSAALWDLRSELGAATTDTLVLEHHFGLSGNATMTTAALAMVAADLNLNGGSNEGAIRNAFCDRGILSGGQCGPVVPPSTIGGAAWNDLNGNGIRDGGEPVLPNWRIYLDQNQNGQFDSFNGNRTATDVPKAILDHQTAVSVLNVSGIGGTISDLNLTLNIIHTYDSDLTVELEAPTGARITLFDDVGGSSNNFSGTVLDDEAATSISTGLAPFAGSYRPQQALSTFDGFDPNGFWRLRITDNFTVDTGTLNSWSLTINTVETSTLTSAAGAYSFPVSTPGLYHVAEVVQPDWTQTFPVGGTHLVALNAGQSAANVDFGNRMAGGAEVVGRHLFYNNSAFDGFDPAANSFDDAAIAVNKLPLFAGQTATFQNYSSYAGGINGVMIDIADLAAPALLSAADFQFHVGNENNLGNWIDAPTPTITVAGGGGVGGSDRVTLTWPDRAIVNQWLEIQVLATSATGLAASDTFYFGNAVGQTDPFSGDTLVNGDDFLEIRLNPRTFLLPADIDNHLDLNRDGRVNAADLLIVRDFASNLDDILELIVI